jgi:hypothetical protein
VFGGPSEARRSLTNTCSPPFQDPGWRRPCGGTASGMPPTSPALSSCSRIRSGRTTSRRTGPSARRLNIRTASRCDPPSGRAGPVRRSRGPRIASCRCARRAPRRHAARGRASIGNPRCPGAAREAISRMNAGADSRSPYWPYGRGSAVPAVAGSWPRHKRRTAAPKGGCSKLKRRRPTLPGPCEPSTIGAERLNCSVRNGKRCFPLAIATANCERPPSRAAT